MVQSTRADESLRGRSYDDAVSERSQDRSDYDVETGQPLMVQSTRTEDTQLRRLHGDVTSGKLERQEGVLSPSQDHSDYEVQTSRPLLQQCDVDYAEISGTDEAKSDSFLATPAAQDLTTQPDSCMRATAPSTIGQAVLDVCITAASIYFVAFAIVAISQNGKSAASYTARHLLEAARLGPTIWPIMFSAIIGRFLTSIAAWRLERGVNVASVEYLLGSRTVFGVISTPLRLRFLHRAIPLLVTLWVLSPLGGQASLRVVHTGPVLSNTTLTVSYLESLLPYWMAGGASGPDGETYGPTVNAIFIGALIAPKDSKAASQDMYGNLKIPLLEDLQTHSDQTGDDGWYSTKTNPSRIYSSMIGLPARGVPEVGRMDLAIESSYLYPKCTLSDKNMIKTSGQAAWDEFRKANCHNGDNRFMAIDFDADDRSIDSTYSDPSTITTPRTIVFGSNGTMATCVTTTTYVETRFTCEGRRCEATAMRESRAKHNPAAATPLDRGIAVQHFCSMFINSTGVIRVATYSPLERYFTNTDSPFAEQVEPPRMADLGDTEFSQRFAQLLNTYWLALTAPFSVTGNLSAVSSALVNSGRGFSRNATAQLQTTETVLVCNSVWLVVLLVGSLAMLTAGIATTTLNLNRRGPEVLDSFASMLRDSPHVYVETGPSTEDGSDKARRLQKTMLMLGDVCPLETTGFVALATQTDGDGIDHVQRLRDDRVYR